MVQSSLSPLSLKLVPMQLATGLPDTAHLAPTSLLLLPDQASSLVLQLKNQSAQPMRVEVQMDGDCPMTWYRLGLEGQDILPHQQMDAVLYFRVPKDFFESPQAIAGKATLRLDYRLQISVAYTATDAPLKALAPVTVNLHVRPVARLLQYLPRVYQEVDFISRLVQIFDQGLTPIVESHQQLWAYLDPLTAPVALLPFLAHWVGWPFDAHAEVRQQRYLIRHAMEIYRWRGTRRGLRLLLHLYTGLPLDDHRTHEAAKHIAIEEAFHKKFSLASSQFDNGLTLGKESPHHFEVRLRLTPEIPQLDESLIHRLIEQEKPAFCSYDLHIEPPP